MLTNKAKYKLKEFLFLIVSYILFSIITILTKSNFNDFPWQRVLVGSLLFGAITGLFEIFLSDKIMKNLSQGLYLINTILYYLISFSFLIVVMSMYSLIYHSNLSFQQAFNYTLISNYYIANGYSISEMFLTLTLFTAFITLSRKYMRLLGYGIALSALRGRYSETIIEEKIFMFMDLKSSTHYAEKLGPKRYSKFIKDIFLHLDEPILESKGFLYQYVGDEVVVVWDKKIGLKNNNALKLKFLIEEKFDSLALYYCSTYGITPKFKFAYHAGEVAVTEIGGILKREIAFHGDAINTTSRISQLCNEIDKSFLISKDLIKDHIILKDNYFNCIGEFKLKGKKNNLELFTITKNLLYCNTI